MPNLQLTEFDKRTFHPCPSCGKRGYYQLRDPLPEGEWKHRDDLRGNGRWRCKYCGYQDDALQTVPLKSEGGQS